MSKKFKGKLCAYCATAISDTQDHLFARELFLVTDRGNLPKVPACDACNGRKSQLEHYAASVLPFGGRHSAALTNLQTMIPKRLEKSKPLFRSLDAGKGDIWVQEGSGLIVPTLAIPIDGLRLKELFEFIVRGLIWHHWRIYLRPCDSTHVMFLTTEGDRQFKAGRFERKEGKRASESFGNGTVEYEGIQDPAAVRTTAWRIRLYGGIQFATGNPAEGVCSIVGVTTQTRNSADDPKRLSPSRPIDV